jgi:hypothetical protein
MARCNHLYVETARTPLGNGQDSVTYRCGTCGDQFTTTEPSR